MCSIIQQDDMKSDILVAISNPQSSEQTFIWIALFIKDVKQKKKAFYRDIMKRLHLINNLHRLLGEFVC